jgi:hypothetical protein
VTYPILLLHLYKPAMCTVLTRVISISCCCPSSFLHTKGKTNDGQKLFGRCMRNADVNQCGVGSFALYLMMRFEMTGEMNPPPPDFTDNREWFLIKLLSNGHRGDQTASMANDSYAKGMKLILKSLGIASSHYVHLGRVMGPVKLEFEELDQEDIRTLGNWNPSTQEKSYSSKLPMKAIRTMAGFTASDRMHYNPRVSVEPPLALRAMVFPWVEDSLKAVMEKTAEDGVDRYTAVCFLKLMQDLRNVVLQDAAAMVVKYPDRRRHALFRIGVFRHVEWEVSVVDCCVCFRYIIFVSRRFYFPQITAFC